MRNPFFSVTLACGLAAAASLSAAMAEDATAVDDLAAEDIDPAVLDKGPIGQIGIGLGYNTDSGAAVSADASADGLLGEGHKLGFGLKLGEEGGSADIDYRYGPVAGNEDLTFNLSLQAFASRATDAFDFVTRSVDLTPRLIYSVSDSFALSPYLTYSSGEISDVLAGTSILIASQEGSRTKTALGLEASYATGAEDGLWGVQLSGGLEVGRSDTGQDFTSLSFSAQGDRFVGTDGAVRLTASLSAGTIASGSGASHIGDRTILGPSMLRGFEFGGIGPRDLAVPNAPALGGNSFAVLRFEARAPNLFKGEGPRPVPGVFFDQGSLWGLDDTAGGVAGADPVDDGLHMRASVGLMMDLETKIGVFQMSVSHPVQKQSYDREAPFNLGYKLSF